MIKPLNQKKIYFLEELYEVIKSRDKSRVKNSYTKLLLKSGKNKGLECNRKNCKIHINLKSNLFDEICVSTDSSKIASIAKKYKPQKIKMCQNSIFL